MPRTGAMQVKGSSMMDGVQAGLGCGSAAWLVL